MNRPLPPYTVLISVYAGEDAENLRQSLESILTQTYPPDEVVLVKDGPLTRELDGAIEDAVNRAPEKLFVAELSENGGLAKALNEGLEYCKNEYVARADSDDVCLPERMLRQMEFLAEHPEIDILSAAIDEFEGDVKNVVSRRSVPLKDEDIWEFAKTRCPFNHNCVVYKKSKVLKAGGYDPQYRRAEDHELWMRMHALGAKGANLEEALVLARLGQGAHKRSHGRQNAEALRKFYKKLYDEKQISFPRYIYDVFCACTLQMLPPKMSRFCYKLIRLKKKPYRAKKTPTFESLGLRELNEEEKKQAQAGILEIYRDVKKLCDEHGLSLILSGGSCLGAVRCRGFIPWDDDMDAVMPRADYEKLKLVFDSALGDKYALQAPGLSGHRASNLFMKIVKRDGPEFIQPMQAADEGEKGLWLDVVPMEYAPEGLFKRFVKGVSCDVLAFSAVSVYLYKHLNPVYAAYMKRSAKGKIKYWLRNALGFALSFRSYEKWYALFDRFSRGREASAMVTFPAGIKHYLGECLPLSVFLPPIEAEFEGEKALLPAKAHTYLRSLYGADYLTPPSEERRRGHLYVRDEKNGPD